MLNKAIKLVNKNKILDIQPNYWCTSCQGFPDFIEEENRCGNVVPTYDGSEDPCLAELKKVTIIVVED